MKNYIIQADLTILAEEKTNDFCLYECANDCIRNPQTPIYDVIDKVQELWSELLNDELIIFDDVPIYSRDVYSFVIYEINKDKIETIVYINKRGVFVFDKAPIYLVDDFKRNILYYFQKYYRQELKCIV